MDDKQKAKLADKLSGDRKLDSRYTKQNRAWFARKVVDAVAAVKPDAQVEAEATRVIGEANKRVKSDRDFKTSVPLDTAEATLERRDTVRRVEAIYGAIARTLELAETTNDALRQFIVRRRYRTAVRMVYHVNPNSNGYFFYPGACDQAPPPGRTSWRTNIDTKDLWERAGVGMVPLRVKASAGGTADPKSAAEKLWIAHPNACDANLFDCAHAVCCVLMDSLFEGADSDKLFKAVNARGPKHLLIVNPTLFKEQHFLWEKPTEPKKLFSKEAVPPDDLQLGDHVYIWNHGLYAQLWPPPFYFWSGEHAVVTNCGTRKFGDGKGFLFSGHGLDEPTTVEALYDKLIKDLQTALHRTYAIATIFLSFRRSGNVSIPAAKVQTDLFQAKMDDGAQVDVVGYQIEAKVRYIDYSAPPVKGSKPRMVTEDDFVAFEIDALKAIGISQYPIPTINAQRAVGIERLTPLVRTAEPGAGGNKYDTTLWQIPYVDTDTDARKTFPLFGGPKGSLRLLDRKEMPKFKFGRLDGPGSGAAVTRPTSDPSSTYVSFLRSSGAIP